MSLIEIARSLGMKTERWQVPVEELSLFNETAACGTAAVISAIGKIFDPEKIWFMRRGWQQYHETLQ
jgi:branched-chain amino acid aminotransferase